MKATDSTNHQTSIADKLAYYVSIVGNGYTFNESTPKTVKSFAITTRYLDKSLSSLHLTNVKAIELSTMNYQERVVWLGKNIAAYMPELKALFFRSSFKDKLIFHKDMISILHQLEIINLYRLDLSKKHEKKMLVDGEYVDLLSIDEFFLAWLLIHGNLDGILKDGSKFSEVQTFLKEHSHRPLQEILAKLPQELVQFVPEIIVGSNVLNQNMLTALAQLETIDLSGRELDQSYDKLFLAWRMIKGNLKGITINGSKLSDVQGFLKDADSLDINEVLATIEKLDKDLFKVMEEAFQINAFRNAIEKLDRILTSIKKDLNEKASLKAEESKEISPVEDPEEATTMTREKVKLLHKAIATLSAEDIFVISLPFLSNTKIPISGFLNKTKIENTEITSLNKQPGQFGEFIRNMALFTIFAPSLTNLKLESAAQKNEDLEPFKKFKKTGSILERFQKYFSQEDWKSHIEYFQTRQQEKEKQQFNSQDQEMQEEAKQQLHPQDEEVKQEFAGDNMIDCNPLGAQNSFLNDLD